MAIPDRKKLWFFIGIRCFQTCDPELSRKHAEVIVNNIKTREELMYVRELLRLK